MLSNNVPNYAIISPFGHHNFKALYISCASSSQVALYWRNENCEQPIWVSLTTVIMPL